MFTWSHILWQLYSWCWQCWRDRACYMSHRVTSLLASLSLWQEHSCVRYKSFSSRTIPELYIALIFNELCTSFWPLNLINVTNSRDVVKLILLLTFFTLWCLFDDMADIQKGKAHFYKILRPSFSLKTWQYGPVYSIPCVLLFMWNWFSMSGPAVACVTRVRYDYYSEAHNLLILIIISQVWSEINILVSECDNRDIIWCPVYTAPYVRLSPILIGRSSRILASDWSISPR